MKAEDLRLAIEQAWEQSQRTAKGHQLDEIHQLLSVLRSAQAAMAQRIIQDEG